MTRKTGKTMMRARQQLRAAKVARSKRELAEAGVSLSMKRPPVKAVKEKEKELKSLYLEMFPEEGAPREEPAELELVKADKPQEEQTPHKKPEEKKQARASSGEESKQE